MISVWLYTIYVRVLGYVNDVPYSVMLPPTIVQFL